jgi:hypothetical protein
MDSKKVKQAFKESVLFRESAFQKFEEQLNKVTYLKASKILESFKVGSLSQLKEQVLAGEVKVDELDKAMKSDEMKTEPIVEAGEASAIADSPAKAEEGNKTNPTPKGEEVRENADADADDAKDKKPMQEEAPSDAKSAEQEPTLKQVMEKLDALDKKMEAFSGKDMKAEQAEPAKDDSSKPADVAPEAQPEEKEKEGAEEEESDIKKEELPEPPVMAESADGETEETDEKKEPVMEKSKKGDFKELFKLR